MAAEAQAEPESQAQVGDPKADRYSWFGAEAEDIEVTASGIARHIARSGARVIGLLPTGQDLGDNPRGAVGMSPLLAALAAALVRFVDQEVAIIDHWQCWKRAVPRSGSGADAPPSRVREIRPRVVDVSPTASTDAPAAAVALQNALKALRKSGGLVLVHLGGYAPAGTAPATMQVCDGIVLVVSERHTRISVVDALAKHLPGSKRLGAILIGGRS
jgi:hypothetical protein